MLKISNSIPTFPYKIEIIRSKRKYLSVSINNGNVIAKSPLNASKKWIYEFISTKHDWIVDQLPVQAVKHNQRLQLTPGAKILFMGQERSLSIETSHCSEVVLDSEKLTILTRKNDVKTIEKVFNKWLQNQAREYMGPKSFSISRSLGVEHKLSDIKFRKTRTKWGHCNSDGVIQYNWLVMMAPTKVIDYLIVHECSHLKHLNHSKQFWATVASLCPDWKQHRHWLEEQGHRFWTHL